MATKTYTVTKQLNSGLWKWEDGKEKVFTILSPIRAGRAVANPRNGIAKAPDLITVRDAETGDERDLLVATVLRSTLTENYPDDSYVGKSFACTQGPAPEGKRYKSMSVNEVELGSSEPKKGKR